MSTQTAQVVMLPQNKEGWNEGDITLCIDAIMSGSDKIGTIEIAKYDYPAPNPYHEAQHIYITTNYNEREIKKGDWYYSIIHNKLFQSIHDDQYFNENDCPVIASTDPALGLPAIPITWIRDTYVPSNGSIKEVLLRTIKGGFWFNPDVLHNEVVIVDGAMEVFEKVVEGYVSHEEGLKQLKQMEADQELEDAANNWIDSHYNKGVEYSKAKKGAANPKSGFIAGAEWAKQQNNWISVKDRNPDNDDIKLVWFAKATHFPDLSYGGCELAWWDGKHWGDNKHDNIENNAHYMTVTHWMNLPNQPNHE